MKVIKNAKDNGINVAKVVHFTLLVSFQIVTIVVEHGL